LDDGEAGARLALPLPHQRGASNWMRKGRCSTLHQCIYVSAQTNPFERDMHQASPQSESEFLTFTSASIFARWQCKSCRIPARLRARHLPWQDELAARPGPGSGSPRVPAPDRRQSPMCEV